MESGARQPSEARGILAAARGSIAIKGIMLICSRKSMQVTVKLVRLVFATRGESDSSRLNELQFWPKGSLRLPNPETVSRAPGLHVAPGGCPAIVCMSSALDASVFCAFAHGAS